MQLLLFNEKEKFSVRSRCTLCLFIYLLVSFGVSVSVAGRPEASTVTYRVGECMQELIKLWKEYESSQAEKTSTSSHNGPTLEMHVAAEYVTATNRQVR